MKRNSTAKLLTCASLSLLLGATIALDTQAGNDRNDNDKKQGSVLKRPLSLKAQGSMCVGGRIVHTDAATGTPGGLFGTNAGTVAAGQMYVQYQIPEDSDGHLPVVLIHGGTLTGSCYETTPDGRMGWVEYFARRNHAVYLPDQVDRGRSGYNPEKLNKVRLGDAPITDLPNVLALTREQAWEVFRFGPTFGVPFRGQQFPVRSVDTLAKQSVPDITGVPDPNVVFPTAANLAKLARDLKGVVLIGHSQSGLYPENAALIDPTGIKAMVTMEPVNCTSAAATQNDLRALAKIPTLVVFGDFIEDSNTAFPDWPASLADCRNYVNSINALGGKATLLHLPAAGVKGNSHMLMQDKNNLEVAELIISWIEKQVERRRH
jgi:pimeloyl-ACP methyl ester carboxylesterase